MLDTIHHQGLRLAFGAFRTSPTESLYVEAKEPSLYIRRKKLSLHYATRISSDNTNPAKDVVFKPNYTEHFFNKPNEIKPFSLRVKEDLDELHIKPESIIQNIEEDIPPWTYRSPGVNLNISS